MDGERFLTMDIKRPPTVSARLTGYNLTERDGRLVRETTVTDGQIGAWPLSRAVSLDLGEHELAGELSDLGLGDRAVQRLIADCTFRIGPPTDLSG